MVERSPRSAVSLAQRQKHEIEAQRDRAEHALVSTADTTLELAKTYQHAESTTGAVTDAIAKLHDLLKQLRAGVDLDAGTRLTQATVRDETAETLLVWGRDSDAAREALALFESLVCNSSCPLMLAASSPMPVETPVLRTLADDGTSLLRGVI